MTALDLFLQLTAGGYTLSRLDGDRLQIYDPQHILSDALRQQIRAHKAALLAMLTPERRIPLPRSPAPCWRCKGPSERHGLRYLLCVQCQEQEDQRKQHTERA
jgi:hypothetical protein